MFPTRYLVSAAAVVCLGAAVHLAPTGLAASATPAPVAPTSAPAPPLAASPVTPVAAGPAATLPDCGFAMGPDGPAIYEQIAVLNAALMTQYPDDYASGRAATDPCQTIISFKGAVPLGAGDLVRASGLNAVLVPDAGYSQVERDAFGARLGEAASTVLGNAHSVSVALNTGTNTFTLYAGDADAASKVRSDPAFLQVVRLGPPAFSVTISAGSLTSVPQATP